MLVTNKLKRRRPRPGGVELDFLHGREDYGDYTSSIEEGERFDRYGVQYTAVTKGALVFSCLSKYCLTVEKRRTARVIMVDRPIAWHNFAT